MPKAPAVFAVTLRYVKEAYVILGVEDPPALPLLIHAICAMEGRPTVTELADMTGLTLKTTSRALGAIRKLGLIEMEIDETDTRLKRCHFTKRGREVERGLFQNIQRLARDVTSLL